MINRKSSLSNAESAVMGERGLLILLLAGYCVPSTNQIRKHVFVETVKSWSEAQSYCREKHTDLATMRSQEEAEQILKLTEDSFNDAAWIGLYRDDTQNWKWSNSDDVIYSNWTADLFCASVNSMGEWDDRLCNEIKAFMCYAETINITERYTLIEEPKTWTAAQQYCREHHTDLVSIKNGSENEDLVKKAQGKPFWIGLFNEPWKWSRQGDNYTFHNWNREEPNNFEGKEKCVAIGLWDSLHLLRGEWNDVDCSRMLPFFCCEEAESSSPPSTPVSREAEASSPPSTPVSQDSKSSRLPSKPATTDLQDPSTVQSDSQSSPTTEPAASQTPDGGEQSQQPSTMGSTSPRVSSPGTSPAGTATPVPEELHLISHSMVWPEAWQYCRDHYTDLVSLTSLAAQNRVSGLVRNSTALRFWIGLHRTVVYDNWYWVAGKDKRAPLNYTNWAPGEPNNPYYEHCGEMVLGEDGGAEWNDLCCYEKLPFICLD
ncbi:putative C-type lectin domain family 20 member A [Polyodon spathula]|uniref:putative C-type lectin domain family 20 member A n=1 Tax=Polyodon spathula TaxID=7913 RepID=UPI001B7F52C5|nr:putative C-type lectin domain family 20 member A [Polyodon spathula]